ncbi:type II and III secretion system protein, partial [bacterium]|nr:type II and III secretion system protein [bacterium]
QVRIEARLVDMTVGAVRDLGSRFEIWRRDRDNNSILNGSFSETQQGTPIIGQDALGNDRILGYEDSTLADVLRPADALRTAGALVTGTGPELAIGDMVTVFNQTFNLSAYLRLFEERQVVEILANPRVVTLNKVLSTMRVVQEIPYLTTTVSQGVIEQSAEFKDAGILIEVTPTVTANGYVRLKIHTDQSIRVADQTFLVQGFSNTIPVIDRRETNTEALVSSGDTIMTGGLRQLNMLEITTGVPWLHQIPVLGWLFKSKTTEQEKKQLFLFMTPEIIEEVVQTVEERGWYDRIDAEWHLPDYFMDDVKNPTDMD